MNITKDLLAKYKTLTGSCYRGWDCQYRGYVWGLKLHPDEMKILSEPKNLDWNTMTDSVRGCIEVVGAPYSVHVQSSDAPQCSCMYKVQTRLQLRHKAWSQWKFRVFVELEYGVLRYRLGHRSRKYRAWLWNGGPWTMENCRIYRSREQNIMGNRLVVGICILRIVVEPGTSMKI